MNKQQDHVSWSPDFKSEKDLRNISVGVPIVFGIPKVIKPIVGWRTPMLKVRFRFRENMPAHCFVRICTGVVDCILRNDGDTWGLIQVGENRTVR